MSTIVSIKDLDVVYLSYDEPNCEENWRELQKICARAQRVHGVKGSDAAHKACAELAQTQRFITIDGDNRINPEFLTTTWQFDQSWNIENSVLSFASRNSINGLEYGNGGIKIWPRTTVQQMRTHEAAVDDTSSVDFCWSLDYVLMPGVWSDSIINSTKQQAWRAGFREGVKLTLVDGVQQRLPADQWRSKQAKNNYDRLCTWLQVGLDQPQGFWAILGARQGAYKTLLTTWNSDSVQDFDTLDFIWQKEAESLSNPGEELLRLGSELHDKMNLPVSSIPLSPAQSQWFKTVFRNPSRTQPKRLKG